MPMEVELEQFVAVAADSDVVSVAVVASAVAAAAVEGLAVAADVAGFPPFFSKIICIPCLLGLFLPIN